MNRTWRRGDERGEEVEVKRAIAMYCDVMGRGVEINKELELESDERYDFIQNWWRVHLR